MSKHPLYNNSGLQKNNKSHVLYALANKQMELQQLEEEYSKKIVKIKGDLVALETTICLFDKDCSETIAKISQKSDKKRVVKQNSYFERGEIKKIVLKVLRTADKPLKTDEISLLCQKLKQLPTDSESSNKSIQKMVSTALRGMEKSRLVEQVGKEGLSIIWKIKELSD